MTATGKQLAAILEIADRKLRELRDAGVLPSPGAAKWNVVASVKAFIKHELDSVSVTDLEAATEAAKLENEALSELGKYDPGAFNSRCKDYVLGLKEAVKNDENDDEN
jgi:hypothetical protein